MRSDFSERLSELILEHHLSTKKLASALSVNGSSVYRWRQGKRSISLKNALLLADFFQCSLEFLIGRTEHKLDYIPHPCPPFYERLRQIMEERNISWYRMVEEKIASDNNFSTWKNGASPYLQSVLDLADYFGVTLDYFVGRER